MNPLMQFRMPLLIIAVLACFGLLPKVQAVSPAPDGGYPGFNTAEGQNALLSLTTGVANTAVGWLSLKSDAENSFNTAVGAGTLPLNTADENTAIGAAALLSNTTGTRNTANGASALLSNTTGNVNVANGDSALRQNTTGSFNVATGYVALYSNTTGSSNTALGFGAGSNLTYGSGNVCIGVGMQGFAGESGHTYIANINTTAVSGGGTDTVTVNLQTGLLGHLASSRRYKEEIKPMGQASETLFGLKPVTFRYKKEVDRSQAPSFGLIAEEVAEISPDLITRDKEGKPYTVRYDAVNAMLLNEFLKAHRRMEEQDGRIEELTAQLKQQAARIQKVSAQVEASKLAPQVVNNP